MDTIQRSVYLSKEELLWFKKNGFSVTKFQRQAIKAHKEGKWEYDRLDGVDE